ncbi:cysteine hydrolase [Ectothiorhodospiraceae bacterium WFHF3C12]|nr:cysteine hydrolase [Ectothiorhodospiraceae bacterium WFHF3C12]
MTRALVLIDIQNDYFTGGAMELVGMEQAAERAATLLNDFRASGEPLFHIQHFSVRPGAGFFLPDTEGVEINAVVKPRDGEPVVRKHFPNAFRETTLLEDLKASGADELILCGAMSHMCVDSTTRAAFDLGFRPTVVSDACATRDLAFNGETVPAASVHAAFMAALAVPFAAVKTMDAVRGED